MTRSVSDLAESLTRRAIDLQRRADALVAELERMVPERRVMGADEARPVIEDLDHAARIVAASARALDAAERRMRLLGGVMARFGEVMSDEAGPADPEELRVMAGQLRLLLLDCTGQHAN